MIDSSWMRHVMHERRPWGRRLLNGMNVVVLLGITACSGTDTVPQGSEAQRGAFVESLHLALPDMMTTLDDPPALPAARVEHLDDSEEVVGVYLNGRARAYPLSVLAPHHAVNDMLGGRPILVTACSVCASAVVLSPLVRGKRLTFRFEGIHRGTPMFYDEESRSLWSHLDAHCVAGPHEGKSLDRITGARFTTWKEWRQAHPATDVVVEPDPEAPGVDGHVYRGDESVPELMRGTLLLDDKRLSPWEITYGVQVGEGRRAYPVSALRENDGIANDVVADVAVTIWLDPVSEALVGYEATAGSESLTFARDGAGRVHDEQTGSLWTLDGQCREGPLRGTRLRALDALQAEWYGWSATWPRTSIWMGPAGS